MCAFGAQLPHVHRFDRQCSSPTAKSCSTARTVDADLSPVARGRRASSKLNALLFRLSAHSKAHTAAAAALPFENRLVVSTCTRMVYA